MTTPAVPKERPVGLVVLPAGLTLPQNWAEQITDLAEDISYAGYSPKATREVIKERVPPMELMQLLIVASQVGNNAARLVAKVHDVAAGRAMQSLMAKHRIVPRASNDKDLTLPRIAISCAPLFYQLRKRVSHLLQDQSFGLPIGKEWQSPALACYSELPAAGPLAEWLKRFGRSIKPKAEADTVSDQRAEQFRLIAVANAQADEFTSPRNLNKSEVELLQLLYG